MFRTEAPLGTGPKRVRDVEEAFNNDVCVRDRGLAWNNDLVEGRNLLTCATQTVKKSALERKESRDACSREDFQDRDDTNCMMHSLSWQGDVGEEVGIRYRGVVFKKLDESECAGMPVKRRTYQTPSRVEKIRPD